MSTSSESDGSPTVQCKYAHCDNYGLLRHYHHGKYCSNECEWRSQGRSALLDILDHTICGTCFRVLKTVEPPKDDDAFDWEGHRYTLDEEGNVEYLYYDQTESRRSAIGFQHRTPNAETGEKQRGDRVVTGTVCKCGVTGTRDHHATLTDRQDISRLYNDHIRPSEDISVDPETLHRVYEQTNDLELAVGKALLERP